MSAIDLIDNNHLDLHHPPLAPRPRQCAACADGSKRGLEIFTFFPPPTSGGCQPSSQGLPEREGPVGDRRQEDGCPGNPRH